MRKPFRQGGQGGRDRARLPRIEGLIPLPRKEDTPMKFGLFGINMGACSNPDTAARVAQAAEAAGFESVWTGDHVVLPDPQVPPSPLPPHSPLLDPAVALAFGAAPTKTLN